MFGLDSDDESEELKQEEKWEKVKEKAKTPEPPQTTFEEIERKKQAAIVKLHPPCFKGLRRPLVKWPIQRRLLSFDEHVPNQRLVWEERPRVINIVATAETNIKSIDLNAAVQFLRNVEYMPDEMVRITMLLRNPPCRLNIFTNGKITVMGCRSRRSCIIALRKAARKLQRIGYDNCAITKFQVGAVAGTCKLGYQIHLEIMDRMFKYADYNPEMSSSLRMIYKKGSARVYKSGIVNFFGIPSVEEFWKLTRKVHADGQTYLAKTMTQADAIRKTLDAFSSKKRQSSVKIENPTPEVIFPRTITSDFQLPQLESCESQPALESLPNPLCDQIEKDVKKLLPATSHELASSVPTSLVSTAISPSVFPPRRRYAAQLSLPPKHKPKLTRRRKRPIRLSSPIKLRSRSNRRQTASLRFNVDLEAFDKSIGLKDDLPKDESDDDWKPCSKRQKLESSSSSADDFSPPTRPCRKLLPTSDLANNPIREVKNIRLSPIAPKFLLDVPNKLCRSSPADLAPPRMPSNIDLSNQRNTASASLAPPGMIDTTVTVPPALSFVRNSSNSRKTRNECPSSLAPLRKSIPMDLSTEQNIDTIVPDVSINNDFSSSNSGMLPISIEPQLPEEDVSLTSASLLLDSMKETGISESINIGSVPGGKTSIGEVPGALPMGALPIDIPQDFDIGGEMMF